MADSKLSALTELTAPASVDIFAIVDDPAGTPVTKKVTLANLLGNVPSGQSLGWSNVKLFDDAANTLALRNGAAAQTLNIYNNRTDASNYERGYIRWSLNLFEIGMEVAGTGVARNIRFGTNNFHYLAGTTRLELRCGGSANHNIVADGVNQYFGALQWSGAFDLGRSAYPFRDIYLRPSASLTPSANGDLCIEATSNTAITFKYKGSDGTVRSGTVTLS